MRANPLRLCGSPRRVRNGAVRRVAAEAARAAGGRGRRRRAAAAARARAAAAAPAAVPRRARGRASPRRSRLRTVRPPAALPVARRRAVGVGHRLRLAADGSRTARRARPGLHEARRGAVRPLPVPHAARGPHAGLRHRPERVRGHRRHPRRVAARRRRADRRVPAPRARHPRPAQPRRHRHPHAGLPARPGPVGKLLLAEVEDRVRPDPGRHGAGPLRLREHAQLRARHGRLLHQPALQLLPHRAGHLGPRALPQRDRDPRRRPDHPAHLPHRAGAREGVALPVQGAALRGQGQQGRLHGDGLGRVPPLGRRAGPRVQRAGQHVRLRRAGKGGAAQRGGVAGSGDREAGGGDGGADQGGHRDVRQSQDIGHAGVHLRLRGRRPRLLHGGLRRPQRPVAPLGPHPRLPPLRRDRLPPHQAAPPQRQEQVLLRDRVLGRAQQLPRQEEEDPLLWRHGVAAHPAGPHLAPGDHGRGHPRPRRLLARGRLQAAAGDAVRQRAHARERQRQRRDQVHPPGVRVGQHHVRRAVRVLLRQVVRGGVREAAPGGHRRARGKDGRHPRGRLLRDHDVAGEALVRAGAVRPAGPAPAGRGGARGGDAVEGVRGAVGQVFGGAGGEGAQGGGGGGGEGGEGRQGGTQEGGRGGSGRCPAAGTPAPAASASRTGRGTETGPARAAGGPAGSRAEGGRGQAAAQEAAAQARRGRAARGGKAGTWAAGGEGTRRSGAAGRQSARWRPAVAGRQGARTACTARGQA